MYTFGYGGQGALGNGAFRDEILPYFVGSLRECGGVLLVGCGFDHTVAITGDLRARAWGRAEEGQLGLDPSSSSLALPSSRGGMCVLEPALMGMCEGDSPALVQSVEAGAKHTLLMTLPRSATEEPVVFSCGCGSDGQLGTRPSRLSATERLVHTHTSPHIHTLP